MHFGDPDSPGDRLGHFQVVPRGKHRVHPHLQQRSDGISGIRSGLIGEQNKPTPLPIPGHANSCGAGQGRSSAGHFHRNRPGVLGHPVEAPDAGGPAIGRALHTRAWDSRQPGDRNPGIRGNERPQRPCDGMLGRTLHLSLIHI